MEFHKFTAHDWDAWSGALTFTKQVEVKEQPFVAYDEEDGYAVIIDAQGIYVGHGIVRDGFDVTNIKSEEDYAFVVFQRKLTYTSGLEIAKILAKLPAHDVFLLVGLLSDKPPVRK